MVTPSKLLSNGAMETWGRPGGSSECQGGTHLPIWGGKRLETGLPSLGRGSGKRSLPALGRKGRY